jgi:hypothetical protein
MIIINKTMWAAAAAGISLLLAPGVLAQETNCSDGVDNDGDTVLDCGDNDCKDDAVCKADGNSENSNGRCTDWIDNDNDGYVDCDDKDCESIGITACEGSWDKAQKKSKPAGTDDPNAMPELKPGMTVEDLLGTAGDNDGERNDYLCSDGIDNDNDGAVDCADFGCRFDPTVGVCRESPGIRFSIVSHITASYDFEADDSSSAADVRFSTLQLRAFGPMPYIQDSFFLISMRTERTPRLTFALFQIPLGGGHFLNINSGGGGLTTGLIRSASKQLLVQQPFYVYNAFEGGNGAAVEVGGPLADDGSLNYRVFLAGGSGRFNGNVGGRFFSFDNTNFTYSVGAQLSMNLVGHVNRWDTPMLYTPVPQALNLTVGAKYDQRAQERYPAANVQLTYRGGRFIATGEAYGKTELEFGAEQLGYNVTVGYLAVPKYLLLAADFGQFISSDYDDLPENGSDIESDIRNQDQELQWRVGAHWYFYRNIGVLSVVYTEAHIEPFQIPGRDPEADVTERELRLVAQYRF